MEALPRGGQGYHAESIVLVTAFEADSLAGRQEEKRAKVEARHAFAGSEGLAEQGRGVVPDEAGFAEGSQCVRCMLHHFLVCWEGLDDGLSTEAHTGEPGKGLEVELVEY